MSQTRQTDLLVPFEIWEVPLDNRTIKFKNPLLLTPTWLPDDPDDPDENEYLSIEIPELNISAWGMDREELKDCIESCIHFGWTHYVRPSDDELNPDLLKIKRNYLAMAEEVTDG